MQTSWRLWVFLLGVGLVPTSATAISELQAIDGFLALEVAESTACAGTGACVAVDVSLAPGPLDDTILFDLQLAWDPTYWTLESIVGADVVARDDAQGFIDDLFADVGFGAPIAIGDTLVQLVFAVTGVAPPARDVLEIGDLRGTDAFFTRPVLVADSDFDTETPSPNARIVTPEPGTSALLTLGLAALARWRRGR